MRLVTHNGSFHYDEILASALLRKLYPSAEIIRTRNLDEIKDEDIAYDVGRIFDPARKRFDHHQNTFDETYSPKYNIKLSSAGLIYKYYGKDLLALYNFFPSSEIYTDVETKIYEDFFLSADAIDNGVQIFGEIMPRTVQKVVECYNVYENSTKTEDELFIEALDFVQKDFDRYLYYIFNYYVQNYMELLNEMRNFDDDIFVTENKYSSELLFEINERLGKDFKFVVSKFGPTEWRVMTFAEKKGSFKVKYPLHEKWRGISGDKELFNVSGIMDCIFVHVNGFVGGKKTKEGAIKMARASLDHLLGKNE